MNCTLHIRLRQSGSNHFVLRYWLDDPNQYEEFTLPADEIADLINRVEEDYYSLLPGNLPELGQCLYNWLDRADRFLDSTISDVSGAADVLVLAFHLEPSLRHLPWELLCANGSYLVQRLNPRIVPIRLYEQNSRPIEAANRALRVLFMASSPRDVQHVLDFEEEEAAILGATARQPIELEVEESGCLNDLGNLIASHDSAYFDVVHINGHADRADEGAYFILEDELGNRKDASVGDLAKALTRIPRLLFLSGCRTGEAGNEGQMPSLAEELIKLGAPAVLGWGRPVFDTDATKAAALLYGCLATGDDMVEALSKTYQQLIEEKAPHWHLLRLYLGGGLPGPFVTPLNKPGRELPRKKSISTEFLDEEKRVRVPTREAFVGRRRAIQNVLRVMRDPSLDAAVGVVIHGIGGIGKSSLASRICDRMPQHDKVVIVGEVREAELIRHLSRNARVQKVREALQQKGDLDMRLLQALEASTEPLLIVLDDYEQNFEYEEAAAQKRKVIKLRDGLPTINPESARVLDALVYAISQSTRHRHRLLITSRYKIKTQTGSQLNYESLGQMNEADVKKKLKRLDEERAGAGNQVSRGSDEEKILRKQAIRVADGNPRLLEWLLQVLSEELDHESILKEMEAKEEEFRENILAEQLLLQQPDGLRQMLARGLVFELPVPQEAFKAAAGPVEELNEYFKRANKLGLLERSDNLLRVPKILAPFVDSEEQEVDTANRALEVLYKMWVEKQEITSEEKVLELWQLALRANHEGIAKNLVGFLNSLWYQIGRYAEGLVLCQKTLEVFPHANHVRYSMAKPLQILGWEEEAKETLELALKDVGDDIELKGTILHALASILIRRGYLNEAMSLYKQSLAISEDINDERGRAITLNAISTIYSKMGNLDKAMSYCKRSLTITKKLGDKSNIAVALHNMAYFCSDQGKLDEALAFYKESLAIKEQLDDAIGKATTMKAIADIYVTQGSLKDAMFLCEQSLEIQEQIGNVGGKAAVLHLMAEINAIQGNLNEAMSLYLQSLSITERTKDVYNKAMTLASMADVQMQLNGDYSFAIKKLQESYTILFQMGSPNAKSVYKKFISAIIEKLRQEESEEEANRFVELLRTDNEEQIEKYVVEKGLLPN